MINLFEKFYPKVTVPEMGKFTQKWYGKKWVKRERRFVQWRNGGDRWFEKNDSPRQISLNS